MKIQALGIYKKLLLKDNRLRGVILVGDTSDERRYMDWLRRNRPWRPPAPSAVPAARCDPGLEIAEMPDSETICGCMGVSKGAIIDAIHEHRHQHAEPTQGAHARLHQLRKLHRPLPATCCARSRPTFRKRPEPRCAPACRSPMSSLREIVRGQQLQVRARSSGGLRQPQRLRGLQARA